MGILKFLTGLALLASAAWMMYDPGFEPAITCLLLISSLIAFFVKDRRSNAKANISQTQNLSGGASGVQVGGNVNIDSGGRADERE